MGRDKLSLAWRGEPVVTHALGVLLACPDLAEVLVVTRPGARLPLPPGRWRLVENPDADEGMASSLRAGVAASPERAFFLFALGDMPAVDPTVPSALVAAWRAGGADAVVPVHRGRRGHPVLLPETWRTDLLSLGGDRGARDLLRARADRVLLLAVDDPGILFDLDRPEDVAGGPGSA
jgi:molybdenum cofactor cytidylyltransferase